MPILLGFIGGFIVFVIVWLGHAAWDISADKSIRSYVVYPAKSINKGFPHIIPVGNVASATYEVTEAGVIERPAGQQEPVVYRDCQIKDLKNWFCQHASGARTVGFKGGIFFQSPSAELAGVTRLQFMILVARWQLASDSWSQKAMSMVVPFRNTGVTTHRDH